MSHNKLISRPFNKTFMLGFICAALIASNTFALPEDRTKPITGNADKLEMDQKTGVATYSGNVELNQGSLIIRANIIRVFSGPNNSIQKITAQGNPAHFSQQPSSDQKVVNASATEITYSPEDERLLLVENAQIEQDGQMLKAPHIDYDLLKEVMKADQVGTSRVDIFIPAKTDKK